MKTVLLFSLLVALTFAQSTDVSTWSTYTVYGSALQCVGSLAGILPAGVITGYFLLFFVMGTDFLIQKALIGTAFFMEARVWNQYRLHISGVCPLVYAYFTQ